MLPSRSRGRPDAGPFALRTPRYASQTEHRQAEAYGPVRITFALQPRSVVRALLWTIAILVTLSTVGRLIVGSLEVVKTNGTSLDRPLIIAPHFSAVTLFNESMVRCIRARRVRQGSIDRRVRVR